MTEFIEIGPDDVGVAEYVRKDQRLSIHSHNFRLVQDGPLTYHSENFEFGRWNMGGHSELLPEALLHVHAAMVEEMEALRNVGRLVSHLKETYWLQYETF